MTSLAAKTVHSAGPVNIYDIPIAEITEQYLEYLDYAIEPDLDNLVDFYSMAANLIYIIDVNVIALIDERGREVLEFMKQNG